MLILNKLKSLIKIIKGSSLGLFIIIQFIISNKKTNIVKLFSSKFGHFLVNTEIFLRERYNNKENFIFFTEETIDNKLLLNLWNKKLKITSYNVGFFLQKCSFFLGKTCISVLRNIQDHSFLIHFFPSCCSCFFIWLPCFLNVFLLFEGFWAECWRIFHQMLMFFSCLVV